MQPEPNMIFDITPADEADAQSIEAQLLTDLRQQLPQNENRHFIFSATSSTGRMLGGVTAGSSYGWLLIKTLWVHKDHRRNGIGKALLNEVESAGQHVACHSAWLDTSNPCAKLFYCQCGFEVFAELQNNAYQSPSLHTRWFMKKSLVS